ncbi:RAS oncogene RAB34-like protein [Euroglyphus maynei]|uniref:RAS oncogene RAB34-like protein n=1 Tax=Euroglyphus maynei TaxID=6958 RepID=A0A1Y3AXD4_EURMA|nr:RAS oncogene RAB34-like protein [Euroglyphus maynei]
MATERAIDSWVYPMDSSCTPYNENDFSSQVRTVCQEELDYMLNNSTNESQPSNQQSQTNKLPPLEPLRNRLRIAKCNIVGDISVGKTCLVNRFGYDVFDSKSKATIGVDFDVQKFSILNRPFTLQIWDTAGDERFRSITRAYYRGAHAALIVFDLTTIKSFHNIGLWHDEIMEATQSPEPTAGSLTLTRRKSQRGSNSYQHHSSSSRPFLFLVGTKKDLITDETVAFYRSEGAKLANKIGAEFWMVSSHTGENVTDLFKRVACLCFDRYILRELRVQQDRTSMYEQQQRALAAMVADNPADEQNAGHASNKRSVHYSKENGGKVAFFYKDDQRNGKTPSTVDQALWPLIVEWWYQWFGQQGKIRRRLGRVTSGNKVTDQYTTNNNQSKRLDDKSHRKFQCFRFTCLYNVD